MFAASPGVSCSARLRDILIRAQIAPALYPKKDCLNTLRHFTTFVLAILLASSVQAATIQEVVSQVNQARYKMYHDAIEDCGLGLYGGSAYNNGSRSRYWTTPPNLGNREAQLYMSDVLGQNPRLIVTSGVGQYENVIAELPGLDPSRKDEVYVISGHFDTTGSYNRPGGDDNASGAAGVLEAAKVMSQYYFAATIHFVGFNAEEGTHGGSLDYVARLSTEQRRRTRNLNMDMILHGRDDRAGHTSDPYDIDLWTSLADPAQLEWMNKFRTAANTYVPSLLVDLSPDDRGSSDHQSFYLAGIPAFTLIEFDVPAWQGGANKEYHTASDFRYYEPNGAGRGYLENLHWSYPYATDIVRASVAMIAQEAGLLEPLFDVHVTDQNRTSAVVRWQTTLPGTSRVEYGLTPQYSMSTPLDAENVTTHAVTLTGLVPGQQYHYRVISVTPDGTEVSGDMVFTTTKMPMIHNVWVSSNTGTSVAIRWRTDVPASSRVEYGPDPGYGVLMAMDPTLVTDHEYVLTGLTVGSTYHFRVLSSNASGTAMSGDYAFNTAVPVPDILIDNTDPGFSVTLGSWSSGTTAPKIGTDYLYGSGTGSQLDSSVTRRCRWTPAIATPGYYNVYAYLQRGTNRTLEAPYTITHARGMRKSYSSHYLANTGSIWHALAGSLPFNAGSSGYVELANNTPDTNYVSADAVKFVFAAPLDVTPPPAPTVSFDRMFAALGEIVRAYWQADDLESGIVDYQYQVRDGLGDVIVPWTDTDNVSAVISGSAAGQSLYVDARARNAEGLWSAAGTGGPVLFVQPQSSMSGAKRMVPGTNLVLRPMVLTASFDGYAYVQSPSEYSAIRVDAATALPPGTVVSASGVLASIGGEMRLSGGGVGLFDAPGAVRPLGISAKSLGGSDVSESWRGVSEGWGPNNVGLLVSVIGEVTRAEGSESFFYVMDRVGTTDSTGLGIKVYSMNWAKPVVGQLVRVRGISHFREEGGLRVPELLMQQGGAFDILQ